MSVIILRGLNFFNRQLQDFEEQVAQNCLKLQQRVALDLLTRIVLKTPVDTGRARGNWQVELGGAGSSTTTRLEPGQVGVGGEATIAAGIAAIGAAKPYGKITIYNNVNYIRYLEDGSSRQAPQGMVKLAVAEVLSQFGA